MNKRVLIVFGTRPEAIKMAPVVKQFQQQNCDTIVCVTAQHRQMLDQVLNFFSISPDIDLNLMKANQSLHELTSNIIVGMKKVISDVKPDVILVHGDTTTSMSSALAAFYERIPIGHVEAGLRTYDKYSPFPEEINRQFIGKMASLNFAPTKTAYDNLILERTPKNLVFITGNTVIDAMFDGLKILETYHDEEIESLKKIITEDRPIILITAHRRENFGEGFLNICRAIKEISKALPQVQLVYPVHPNPNVLKPVNENLAGIDNIKLIKPLGYPAFLWLMKLSSLIITDSGGVQEEAPSLKKPVLVMRDVTERMEAIDAGVAKLVGTNPDTIFKEAIRLIQDQSYRNHFTANSNPYGDGKASEIIARIVLNKTS